MTSIFCLTEDFLPYALNLLRKYNNQNIGGRFPYIAEIFHNTKKKKLRRGSPHAAASMLSYAVYPSSFSNPGCSMFHLSLRREKSAGISTVSLS